MDKNDVQEALLNAAGSAAGLAQGAIERVARVDGDSDGGVAEVEGFANAAKALAEAAEVAGRA